MGAFSKYLDYRQANLPALLHLIDRAVDLHNLADINVFAFFAGMVSSY